MDANTIVQTLGSLLMAPDADRIQGKNQSLYAEPIDRVFNPHRKEWMHAHFEKFARKHSGGTRYPFKEYVTVLKEKDKKWELYTSLPKYERYFL